MAFSVDGDVNVMARILKMMGGVFSLVACGINALQVPMVVIVLAIQDGVSHTARLPVIVIPPV